MRIHRLSCDRDALGRLSEAELIAAIWLRRWFIRYHRDQLGDDRCFLDDWFVWQLLDDTPPMPHFTKVEGTIRCDEFFRHRNAAELDTLPIGAILDPHKWDNDLWCMPGDEYKEDNPRMPGHALLLDKLVTLQEAIRRHRDITDRPRTRADDQALYMALSERLPGDQRLPSEGEFLGDKCAPRAGCPWFWNSHEGDDPAICNLHQWGHCRRP